MIKLLSRLVLLAPLLASGSVHAQNNQSPPAIASDAVTVVVQTTLTSPADASAMAYWSAAFVSPKFSKPNAHGNEHYTVTASAFVFLD